MDTSIIGAVRTPIGALLGSLSEYSAPQLGAVAIRGALQAAGIAPSAVDEVLFGCVLSAGVGMAPARQAARLAGLNGSTPAVTINKVCGSGMKAIMLAADSIRAENAKVVVAGGMESMSNAPHLLPNARKDESVTRADAVDHMFFDGLQAADTGELMGVQAQKTAMRAEITRAEMDEFALRSLERANRAIEDGTFGREIVAVDAATTDELPRKFKADKIPQLRPAFVADGTITAATASSIADGGAALVLTSTAAAQKLGVKPRARLVGTAQFSHAPAEYTAAPIGAIRKLLTKLGWEIDSVGLFEINEAFAMVPLLAMRELGLDASKVNIHGGACALGHPIGCSGSRIVVSLLNAMQTHKVQRGIAAICIGGGEATAIALELA